MVVLFRLFHLILWLVSSAAPALHIWAASVLCLWELRELHFWRRAREGFQLLRLGCWREKKNFSDALFYQTATSTSPTCHEICLTHIENNRRVWFSQNANKTLMRIYSLHYQSQPLWRRFAEESKIVLSKQRQKKKVYVIKFCLSIFEYFNL